MPEDIFHFKQFSVRQALSGMRITTDACVFGAYVARHAQVGQNILDVGTGTGLLSLMLAQSLPGSIDGIELNPNAYEETRLNFLQTPWADRLRVVQGDARALPKGRYDMVLCNPPFFDSEYSAMEEGRRQAMHQITMDWTDVLDIFTTQLSDKGEAWLLLPHDKALAVERMAMQKGLYLKQRLDMASSEKMPWLRAVLAFGRYPGGFRRKESLFFKTEDGAYTDAFRSLLREYYLHC
jgi:tRNA1Val (adenine37-N6)-methyltransferase